MGEFAEGAAEGVVFAVVERVGEMVATTDGLLIVSNGKRRIAARDSRVRGARGHRICRI